MRLKKILDRLLQPISGNLYKNQSMIIKIKNLKLHTIIGVHKWEETIDREIIINAEITTNLTKSTVSDHIDDTVDYDEVIAKIKNLVAENRFKLIEKMAQNAMDLIMQDKRIAKCKLAIEKVGIFDYIDSVSVILEQENN